MNAGPLRYPVGAPNAQRGALFLLALVWALGLGLWAVHLGGQLPTAWWLSACVGCVWLLRGRWQLLRPLQAELVWEPNIPQSRRKSSASGAGQWRWFSPAWQRGLALAEVHCVLDAQHLVVLRWRSATGLNGWAWLHAAAQPAQWRTLRCVLFAAPTPTPHDRS